MFDSFAGKRVTVMGLGRFGGGTGAVRFLVEKGVRVTVTDLAPAESLTDSLAEIDGLALERVRLGGHDPADFANADLIVASPAVAIDHPLLVSAEAAGIPVTTEIGLLWKHCRGQVIGVTGSVGKSTTAALIHAILQTAGRRSWLGGNIGGSLLPVVDQISPDDWVVLELSSFQLERIGPEKFRSRVAVVTNLHPNHLDRHGTLDAYRTAKQNLLRWQTGEDVAVLNALDADVATWSTHAHRVMFGKDVIKRPIDGDNTQKIHSENFDAAVAATLAIGIESAAIEQALQSFRGLPHRLETIGEFHGRLWVNDSKATTPEAAIAALKAFTQPIHLIAGGADKGVDLGALADAIVERAASVSLSGQTGPPVAKLLAESGCSSFTLCESFDASVAAAFQQSSAGDVVLLSPGCASWGQFRDYRERGERFATLAEQLEKPELKQRND